MIKSILWTDHQSFFLKVCERTTAPQWNEAFSYQVRDPREDILLVKVVVLHVSTSGTDTKVNLFITFCLVFAVLPQLDSTHLFSGGSS